MKRLFVGILYVVLVTMLSPTLGRQPDRPLTKTEIEAVKLAILDEIYDYDFQEEYGDILPLKDARYPLVVYVNPRVQIGKAGQAIYKLPTGEVFRVFEFNGGTAVLVGAPRDKFPPTEGSTLTLYLKDEDICAAKRDWIHETILINPHPSKSEIDDAVIRERQRKGTSQHDETPQKQKQRGWRTLQRLETSGAAYPLRPWFCKG